jgi:hypothetical protein
MMNNVCYNKSAGYEVYKDNYKSKEETCKSIVYRKYRHIRLAFVCVTDAMIDCSGEGEKQFVLYHLKMVGHTGLEPVTKEL